MAGRAVVGRTDSIISSSIDEYEYSDAATAANEAPPEYLPPDAVYQWHNSAARATNDGRIGIDFQHELSQLAAELKAQICDGSSTIEHSCNTRPPGPRPPPINIVMQVIGSQGDVQPFVALGIALQQYGHHVRIATHPQFRNFVLSHGLEFYSIGGDPVELMAYMVKNPGLIPKLTSIRSGEIHKRRKAMEEMLNGCWRACYEPVDEITDNKAVHKRSGPPFVARVIIANPPALAHIHCAEKLGIPLHIMFTMPWSPTKDFPHPLASVKASEADAGVANLLSFVLVDTVIWQGLGDIVNRFRRRSLGLEPINSVQAYKFMARCLEEVWLISNGSPSLISKPRDWPMNISVSGSLFLPASVSYNPPKPLLRFLESGPPSVYIGFGSIVVDDPAVLTQIVLQAVRVAQVRAVISKGWSGLGSGKTTVPDHATQNDLEDDGVFYLTSPCPHDWLFARVSCVVHHGGAGTTAAGLAAGKPTAIVPFFGDQHFWGEMVHRYGAGPQPIPVKDLTVDNLAAALVSITTDLGMKQRAAALGEGISQEHGLDNAVDHFHQCLPITIYATNDMSLTQGPTVWQYSKKVNKRQINVSLSALVATTLMKEGLIQPDDLKLHRDTAFHLSEQGALEPFTGLALAMGDFFYDNFRGAGEILYGATGGPYTARAVESLKAAGKRRAAHDDASDWQVPTPGCLPSSASASPRSHQASQDGEVTNPSTPHDTKTSMSKDSVRPSARVVRNGESSSPQTPRTSVSQGLLKHPYVLGHARMIGAGLKVAGAVSAGLASGAHNAPRIWGDTTVRPEERISGVRSGLKAGVKELVLGVSDGISGLVVLPVKETIKGNRESGVAGAVMGFGKGTAKGLASLPAKWFAAMSGIVGYPLKGIEAEVKRMAKGSEEAVIRRARLEEGEWEYKKRDIGERERREIVGWWETVMGGSQEV